MAEYPEELTIDELEKMRGPYIEEELFNLIIEALKLLRRGDYEAAAEMLGDLYEVYPDNILIVINFARSLMYLGRFKVSEGLIFKALKLARQVFKANCFIGG